MRVPAVCSTTSRKSILSVVRSRSVARLPGNLLAKPETSEPVTASCDSNLRPDFADISVSSAASSPDASATYSSPLSSTFPAVPSTSSSGSPTSAKGTTSYTGTTHTFTPDASISAPLDENNETQISGATGFLK